MRCSVLFAVRMARSVRVVRQILKFSLFAVRWTLSNTTVWVKLHCWPWICYKETSKWNTVILRMTLIFPSAVDFEDQSKCDYRLIESFRIIQNDTKSFRLILNPRQFKFTRTATDTSPFLITFPLHVLKVDVFFLWGIGPSNLDDKHCTRTTQWRQTAPKPISQYYQCER